MSNALSARGKVVTDLQGRISGGDLSPGQRLPSRNALADHYGVSHFTIVGALAELSALGYVTTRPRSGVFVEPRTSANQNGHSSKSVSSLAASTVAVIGTMPDSSEMPYLRRRSGWQAATVIGVLDALRDRSLHPLIIHPSAISGSTATEIAADTGGVVIMDDCPTGIARSCVEACLDNGTPVVSGCNFTRDLPCDHVCYDFEHGGYLLASWLFDQGYKNIVSTELNHPDAYWWAPRCAGYQAAAAERGLSPVPSVVMKWAELTGASQLEVRARIAAGYIAEIMRSAPRPDAIILPSDGYAGYFGRGLELNGLIPNIDVAIAGYDNYWVDLPERMDQPPPVVTIDKRNLLFGAALVRLLDQRKKLGRDAEPTIFMVEPILVTADEMKD